VFCNQCGHRNGEGSKFCGSCGAILGAPEDQESTTVTFLPVEPSGELATGEVAVVVEDMPEGAGMLLVKRGPNAGSRFMLEGGVTKVGRHPDSDIFLDDVTVSRRHAEFTYTAEGYKVRDVGSLNGTYLNRERIEEAPVMNGDEVQVGKFKLVFLGAGVPRLPEA